jgi:hypothetical protein
MGECGLRQGLSCLMEPGLWFVPQDAGGLLSVLHRSATTALATRLQEGVFCRAGLRCVETRANEGGGKALFICP